MLGRSATKTKTPETTTTSTSTTSTIASKTAANGKNARIPGLGVDKSSRVVGVKGMDTTATVVATSLDRVDNGEENDNHGKQQYPHGDVELLTSGVYTMSNDTMVVSTPHDHPTSPNPASSDGGGGDTLYSRPMGRRVSVQPKIRPDRLVHHRNGTIHWRVCLIELY